MLLYGVCRSLEEVKSKSMTEKLQLYEHWSVKCKSWTARHQDYDEQWETLSQITGIIYIKCKRKVHSTIRQIIINKNDRN